MTTTSTNPDVLMTRQVLIAHDDIELAYYSPESEGDKYEAIGYVPYTYCRAEDASGAYSRNLTVPEIVAIVRQPELLLNIPRA